MTTRLASLVEDFVEQDGEALDVVCMGRLGGASPQVDSGLPYQLVQAYGYRLSEVHRGVAKLLVLLHGDGKEPVAVAEFVVAEAGLLGAEEQRYTTIFA